MPEDETDNNAANRAKAAGIGNAAENTKKTQRAADTARRRRRDEFLADLAEAQRLRERVAPRRARMARLRQQQLMRTFFH